MRWKYFVVLLQFCFLFWPLFSESSQEQIEIPNLEPEAIYEMTGQDIMGLYQELNNLMLLKNDYRNVAIEILELAKDAETLAQELEKKNNKLTLQNRFLIGTTVVSVGICVVGTIVLIVNNVK